MKQFLMIAGLSCLLGLPSLWAQKPPVAYYLDLNQPDPTTIYSIQNELLAIQYHDYLGQKPQLPFLLYNWQRELVGSFNLSKSYGLNHFEIHLGETFQAWPIGQIYTGELIDEAGYTHRLTLQKVAPSNQGEPHLDLRINPIRISCQNSSGNLVEFYGDIQGGKAPYQVSWYVLNEGRTDFLYHPRQQQIDQPGHTSLVQVEKSPSYYILMHVLDACGRAANRMIYLSCSESKKKINTVFVEPLQPKDLPRVGQFKQ